MPPTGIGESAPWSPWSSSASSAFGTSHNVVPALCGAAPLPPSFVDNRPAGIPSEVPGPDAFAAYPWTNAAHPVLHRAPTTCPLPLPPRRSRERPHPLRLLRRDHTTCRRRLPRRLSRERMRASGVAPEGPYHVPPSASASPFSRTPAPTPVAPRGPYGVPPSAAAAPVPRTHAASGDCSRGAIPCAPFRFRHALLANACAVTRCSAGAIRRAALRCGRAKPGFRAIRCAGAGIALRHSLCWRRCAGHEPAGTPAGVRGRHSVCGPGMFTRFPGVPSVLPSYDIPGINTGGSAGTGALPIPGAGLPAR